MADILIKTELLWVSSSILHGLRIIQNFWMLSFIGLMKSLPTIQKFTLSLKLRSSSGYRIQSQLRLPETSLHGRRNVPQAQGQSAWCQTAANLPTTRSFLDNSSSCTPVQGAQINIHGRMTLLERVSFKFEILNFSLCINLPNTLYLRCGV